MAKKGEIALELSLLKTILSSHTPKEIKSKIIGSIGKELFAFNETKDVYSLIYREYVDEGKDIPSLRVILGHPDLKEKSLMFLKNKKYKRLESSKDVKSCLSSLKEYYKRRKLSEATKYLYESLNGNENSDSIIANLDNTLFELKSGDKKDEDFVTGGNSKDGSSKKLLNDILSKDKHKLSRTGFNQLDRLLGGGCGEGDLVILSATTGGGKTAAAFNMQKFVYSVNHENSIVVSLEMKNTECYERVMSNVSNVLYSKIKSKNLSEEEKHNIRHSWKKYENIGKENNCYYKMWSPTDDVNIHKVLAPLTNMGYKWVFIDYINLLAQEDSSMSEAQMLSSVARYAKRWAQANKCIVVILTQLDEKTHLVRYARAIKEHANTFIWWHYTEEDREKGICNWNLGKSRGSELGSFDMRMDMPYMRITDAKTEENIRDDKNNIDKSKVILPKNDDF